MPKPKKGESKDEFISRCMGYDDMQKYDQKQRAAICYSYWDRKDETIDMETFTNIILERKYDKGSGDKDYGTEKEDDKGSGMDRDQVYRAAKNAAEDIFDKVDTKKLQGIVSTAVRKGKDSEDAIQIAINMLRSED